MASQYKLFNDNIVLNLNINFDLIEFRELVKSIGLFIETCKSQANQDLNQLIKGTEKLDKSKRKTKLESKSVSDK
jgi:hypothetical protein